MQNIHYVGKSDFRHFSRADFEKAKVEHAGLSFAKGQPAEVSNELAEALLNHSLFKGEFELVKEADEEPSGSSNDSGETPEDDDSDVDELDELDDEGRI